MFRLCLLTFLICSSLSSKEICIDVETRNPCEYIDFNAIPITIEHATSDTDKCWGLMGREVLPYDAGMLFYYNSPRRVSLWMFNCFIDLDAAFLDGCQVIREIRHLHCCPCKMDSCRPVDCCEDFAKYPPNDPTIVYFNKQKVVSSFPASYALEMNMLWFQEHGIHPGDVVDWNGDSAWVIRSLDLARLIPCEERPIALILTTESSLSVWLPNSPISVDVAFLDGEKRIVELGRVPGSKGMSPYEKPVIYSTGPVKGMLIAQPGWFERHGIFINDELNFSP